MIGSTVEFNYDTKITQGVILDKFRDSFHDYKLSDISRYKRNMYTYCIIDYYLIQLSNGSLIKKQPSEITRILNYVR